MARGTTGWRKRAGRCRYNATAGIGAGRSGNGCAFLMARMIRSFTPSFASHASPSMLTSKRVRLMAIVSRMNSSLKPADASVRIPRLVRTSRVNPIGCPAAATTIESKTVRTLSRISITLSASRKPALARRIRRQTERLVQTGGDLTQHLRIVKKIADAVRGVVLIQRIGGSQSQTVGDAGVLRTHGRPILREILERRDCARLNGGAQLTAREIRQSIAGEFLRQTFMQPGWKRTDIREARMNHLMFQRAAR